jgi:hypothetical protein
MLFVDVMSSICFCSMIILFHLPCGYYTKHTVRLQLVAVECALWGVILYHRHYFLPISSFQALLTMGPIGRKLVNVFIVVTQFGFCCVYIVWHFDFSRSPPHLSLVFFAFPGRVITSIHYVGKIRFIFRTFSIKPFIFLMFSLD